MERLRRSRRLAERSRVRSRPASPFKTPDVIRRVRQKRTPLTETSVSSASSGGSSPFNTPISVGIDGSTPATSSPAPRALFTPQTLNPRMQSALDLYIADVSEEGGGFAKAGEGRARSEAKRMFELLPLERREEYARRSDELRVLKRLATCKQTTKSVSCSVRDETRGSARTSSSEGSSANALS